MKKIITTTLVLSILTSTCYYQTPVKANEFEGNEKKYMTLCSSANLTNNNKSSCERFNKYLKDKNNELTKDLAKQKEDAKSTKATLENVQKQLESINTQISTKEAEITYLSTTITNLQNNIEKNTILLKERMYAMQSYNNNNTYINFIFGASTFSEMFTRIEGYNELTRSDKELIKELSDERKNIEAQQKLLTDAKANLLAQQEEQKILKNKYIALLNQQNSSIASTQNNIYNYGAMTAELDAAIKKFNEEAEKDPTPVPQPPKPEPKPEPKPDPKPENPDNGNNDNNDNSNTETDNRTLGQKIYAAAYSQLGKRYWWGASGPNYYDCSGLVYWSLKKAGVSVSRDTAAGYSRKWSAVSWSNSKTGDLVCFGSPAFHIGIVIVNNDGSRSVIHAGGGDSSTHGDNPNAKVKISSLQPGSYYYRNMSTIRRVQ